MNLTQLLFNQRKLRELICKVHKEYTVKKKKKKKKKIEGKEAYNNKLER